MPHLLQHDIRGKLWRNDIDFTYGLLSHFMVFYYLLCLRMDMGEYLLFGEGPKMDQPWLFDGTLYSNLRMRGPGRLFNPVSFKRTALACLYRRRYISDDSGISDIMDHGKTICSHMVGLQQ